MRIVVLGGSGQAGRSIVRLLAEQTNASLVVAARAVDKAKKVVLGLSHVSAPERISAALADASNRETLRNAFQGADLVVVTSTTANYTANIVRASLDAGCDYFDILDAPDAVETLAGFAAQAAKAGRLLVTQGGIAPGMPSALVRLVRPRFERLAGARLGLALSLKTAERYEQVYDVFNFLVNTRPMAFEDGAWRQKSLKSGAVIDFGGRFGRRMAFSIDMPELHSLPGALGLKELRLYAAGANATVDYLAKSLINGLHKIRPRLGWGLLARLVFWMAKRATREPSGFSLVLEAWGQQKDGDARVRVLVEHEDNYFATAVVVLSFVRQYTAGTFDGVTGLKMMGHVVDPEQSLQALRAAGVKVALADVAPDPPTRAAGDQ